MHVIVVANAKGGVGKTTLIAQLAGLLAAAGHRVLAIDLDPQGNLGRDLGYADRTDNGDALADTLLRQRPAQPITDVRPGLDVLPGGQALGDVPAVAASRRIDGRPLTGTLADALAPLHESYQWAFIDTPPGERFLVEIGLTTAQHLIIPTRSDDASIDGLEITAQRFVAARQANPALELLGVALFGTSARAARMRDAVRATIARLLEGAAPVFTSEIRYLETAAYDARRQGLLVHELEGAQRRALTDRLARLRRGDRPTDALYSRDASNLAADYQQLAEEIVARISSATAAGTPA